ncbi:hypothetical protein DF186_14120, partial [Enterococcus hirae]
TADDGHGDVVEQVGGGGRHRVGPGQQHLLAGGRPVVGADHRVGPLAGRVRGVAQGQQRRALPRCLDHGHRGGHDGVGGAPALDGRGDDVGPGAEDGRVEQAGPATRRARQVVGSLALLADGVAVQREPHPTDTAG